MKNFLITHTFIEMYNHDRGLVTFEHFNEGKKRQMLFENYGLFRGCDEAVSYIIDKLNCLTDFKTIILAPPSIAYFVDSVRIVINDYDGLRGAYTPNDTIIGEENRFKEITIHLKADSYTITGLTSILMHELTHAYQDYNLRAKNINVADNMKNNGYFRAIDTIKNKQGVEKHIAEFFYYLNSLENGADITDFHARLKQAENKTFETISDAIEFIKKSQVYKDYKVLQEISEWITNNCSTKNSKDAILNAANSISNYKFKSYNGFVKWMKTRVYKVIRKVEEVIPKIACEKLNVKTMFYNPSNPLESPQLEKVKEVFKNE